MKPPLLFSVFFACSLGFSSRTAARDVLTAGMQDGFALPADPASPSSDVRRVFSNQVIDFDAIPGVNAPGNYQMAHTFIIPQPQNYAGALLEIRVRGGHVNGVETDGLLLLFVDATTTPEQVCSAPTVGWSRSFAPTSSAGPCFPGPDPTGLVGSWQADKTVTLFFNLAILPTPGGGTVDIVPQLLSRGFLDVVVGDETAADYFKLIMLLPTDTNGTVESQIFLSSATPNPASSSTTFYYSVPFAQTAHFSVYDVRGRMVRHVAQVAAPGAPNRFLWDTRDLHGLPLPAGTYLLRLSTLGGDISRKVLIAR